jgi:hypothetical protein
MRIIDDDDVETFIRRVLATHGDDIDFDVLEELNRLLKKVEQARLGPSES